MIIRFLVPLPSKQNVSISSDAHINIPPFFTSWRKGEVMINFKFKRSVALPCTSNGNGQNNFPVQVKFGSRLLDPPASKIKIKIFVQHINRKTYRPAWLIQIFFLNRSSENRVFRCFKIWKVDPPEPNATPLQSGTTIYWAVFGISPFFSFSSSCCWKHSLCFSSEAEMTTQSQKSPFSSEMWEI